MGISFLNFASIFPIMLIYQFPFNIDFNNILFDYHLWLITSLLDAIGKTIELTKKRVKMLNPLENHQKVIFVIITDGHENNSKFYNRQQIFKKISKLEKKQHWQFVFLGAARFR